MESLTVLGAGSWGTAIAKGFADRGHQVRLWSRREDQARGIQETRENLEYLSGVRLPDNLLATHDLERALEGSDGVYVVVPSHGLRQVVREAKPFMPERGPIVTATKGIENESLHWMTQVLEDVLPSTMHGRICALGGPSFAREVAAGMPSAVCLASRDHATGLRAQEQLAGERFRVYTTEDVVGVEIGGALKNVMAIAAGAADGLGFGHNARAALITRGLAEMARLGQALGANPLTLAGLSGLGDLVLTCTGDLSRNRRVGLEMGSGRTLAQVLADMRMVAEGVKTAKSAYDLAVREHVDMPITTEVYRALYEGKPPIEAVSSLLSRTLRQERD
ncbi:MAG TPA: NAD(P)H-dependent glycerol-3-phosphate dehydrogenase [Polyangiaceae bacterium]|nr:NAD(P)H-dependent glycerol-3-phosphate dehydrogenase [Polyangiaceae bacterium]